MAVSAEHNFLIISFGSPWLTDRVFFLHFSALKELQSFTLVLNEREF